MVLKLAAADMRKLSCFQEQRRVSIRDMFYDIEIGVFSDEIFRSRKNSVVPPLKVYLSLIYLPLSSMEIT